METPNLPISEFQKALTPRRIFTFQVTSFALFIGATLFMASVLVIYATTPAAPQGKQDDWLLSIFSVVHIGMALVFYTLAFLLHSMIVSPKRLDKPAVYQNINDEELTMESRCFGKIVSGYVVRAAMIEFVAFFGIVICLFGVMTGQIHHYPVYWLNLLSYIIFSAMILITFPTKNKLETLFKERFLMTHQME